MSFLFGHLYTAPCKFTHDQAMFRRTTGKATMSPDSGPVIAEKDAAQPARNDARVAHPSSSEASLHDLPNAAMSHTHVRSDAELVHDDDDDDDRLSMAPAIPSVERATRKRRRSDDRATSKHARSAYGVEDIAKDASARSSGALNVSPDASNADLPPLTSYEYSEAWKQQAFEAATGTSSSDWNDISLVSVSGHQKREEEL